MDKEDNNSTAAATLEEATLTITTEAVAEAAEGAEEEVTKEEATRNSKHLTNKTNNINPISPRCNLETSPQCSKTHQDQLRAKLRLTNRPGHRSLVPSPSRLLNSTPSFSHRSPISMKRNNSLVTVSILKLRMSWDNNSLEKSQECSSMSTLSISINY